MLVGRRSSARVLTNSELVETHTHSLTHSLSVSDELKKLNDPNPNPTPTGLVVCCTVVKLIDCIPFNFSIVGFIFYFFKRDKWYFYIQINKEYCNKNKLYHTIIYLICEQIKSTHANDIQR